MSIDVSSVEDLLQRSVEIRATEQGDVRSELVLELIADALIALLVELQRPVDHPVTSIM